MTRMFPFLWYAKDADKAAEFYCLVFPDSRVDRVTPMPIESSSGPPGSVIVVEFTLFGQLLQAMTAGEHHPFNDAVSLMVECEGQAEIDRYWNALTSDGGQEVACGWCNDRWGVRWQIVPKRLNDLMSDPDIEVQKRFASAMMKKVRIDLAAIEAAARG
jgi:predicted 3-demethylubiquinone-9 3-methyltransferase (glyoxalase superfamily)